MQRWIAGLAESCNMQLEDTMLFTASATLAVRLCDYAVGHHSTAAHCDSLTTSPQSGVMPFSCFAVHVRASMIGLFDLIPSDVLEHVLLPLLPLHDLLAVRLSCVKLERLARTALCTNASLPVHVLLSLGHVLQKRHCDPKAASRAFAAAVQGRSEFKKRG